MQISNSVDINKKFLSKGRQKSQGHSPSFYESKMYTRSNNSFKEKPLNSNSSELSFKGFSLSSVKKVYEGLTPAIEKYSQAFGDDAGKFLRKEIDNLAKNTDLVSVKDDVITLSQKSVAKSFGESLLYPITGMPADIFEFILKSAKKLPGMAESKTVNNLLNSNFLQKRRTDIANNAKVASISSLLEKVKDGATPDDLFKAGHRRLNPLISNYSTDKERGLNRLVTGLIPAVYLGNDAYNLTRLINDDDKEASKEKTRRIKQEVARVVFTAYATFVSLGALGKVINKSPALSATVSTGIVLVAEVFSRLLTNKPITFLSEKRAKELASKQEGAKKDDNKQQVEPKKSVEDFSSNISKADSYNPVVFKSSKGINKNSRSEVFRPFERTNQPSQVYFTNSKEQNEGNNKTDEKKKSSIWPKVGAVLGGLWALGFAANKFKATDFGKSIIEPIKKGYNNIIKEDDLISRADFDKAMTRLRKNGFSKVADKYYDIVKDQTSDMINLGKKDRKVVNPIVNDILIFPVRTVWKWAMMPYNFTKNIADMVTHKSAKLRDADKAVSEAFKTMSKDELSKLSSKPASELSELESGILKKAKDEISSQKKMISNNINFIKKIPEDADFSKRVNEQLLGSFDNVTKSNYSNHNLAKITKLSASAATSYFLIADNYNLVMQKNQDKTEATQKAKERAIQRGYGILYGSFLLSLLNNVFKVPYSKSLFNMSLIGAAYALINETITRKSTGLPLGEKSKDEILAVEKENLESDGLKGKYFRLMKTITGKKTLSEKQASKTKKS